MADIIISRKVQPCPGLSIAEMMSSSSDVIETVIFNPTEYMLFTSGIQETANFNPVESMTYTN
jgi:hypothetical protein